jgi:calcineurin-like phosphoesterase family protein
MGSWRTVLALLLLGGCSAANPTPLPRGGFTPSPVRSLTLAATGNICGEPVACADTSDRVAEVDPDVVLTLGDMAYEQGLLSEFRDGYGGATRPQTRWGRPEIEALTLPGFGNHDCYDTETKLGCEGAVAYFGEDSSFGIDIPGTTGSYYTVRGEWLIVVLNSAGDSGAGRATVDEIASQDQALFAILAEDDHRCEIVTWHHPRFTSGRHGGTGASFVAPWFETAYANGVDVILNAHHHFYERFAPQNADAEPAGEGVREFVVGTGGATLEAFGPPLPNSEARFSELGILTMELGDDGTYSWAFLDDMTAGVFDEGADVCH